uniref:Histone H1.10-like n=1 Tax=Callorhinchus milii TaxID=7868 RepID=A0A4W3HR16_CALMI
MGKRTKVAAPPQRRNNAAPTVGDLIMAAVSASGTHVRRGISLVALKKALSKAGYDVQRNNTRVNQSVKSLVTKGSLQQVTGTGALGSFRVSKDLQQRRPEEEAGGQTQRRKRRRRRSVA